MSAKKNMTLLVLAAGFGSRYGGLKQFDGIGPNKEVLLEYALYDAIQAGFDHVVFVIRHSFAEGFISYFNARIPDHIRVDYVYQEMDIPAGVQADVSYSERKKPWGTAHAVLQARECITTPFICINADDYYGRNSYVQAANFFRKNEDTTHFAMVGYRLDRTLSENGSVSRGVCELAGEDLVRIHETHGIKRNQNGDIETGEGQLLSGSKTASMNLFLLYPWIFDYIASKFEAFVQKYSDNPTQEFYIPLLLTEAINEKRIEMKVLQTDSSWFGVTYKEDKETVKGKIQDLVQNSNVYPLHLWK